jgi:asparagine synthase (glutamine-hydrolysing)
MCGIAGALMWGSRRAPDAAADAARTMTHALAHRGPDGSGVWASADGAAAGAAVALGHARLAIIDLSDQAAQPMKSESAVITYNGETYNFADVGRELAGLGETFRTQSDTEVVLRAYVRWGPAMLQRLRGMFALAIWDTARGCLFLARDRFGIKPLYYYTGPDYVVFASELRALLATGLVPRRLDPAGLWQYLAYQSVPAPRTLVEGVRLLEPGHSLEVRPGLAASPARYWDLLDAREGSGPVDLPEARRRVRAHVERSIAAHLVSDVPVGIFLSGGIDSSAIAALVASLGRRPLTFSVALSEADFNEADQARAAAAACGADHHEVHVHEGDLLSALPEILGRMDHPSGDGINTYVIAGAVRRAGVKVALSGLGGDELFGGYPSFDRLSRAEQFLKRWHRVPQTVRSATARVVGAFDAMSRTVGKASAVIDTDGSLEYVWPITRQVFDEAARRDLLAGAFLDRIGVTRDPYAALLGERFARHPEADWLAKISYAEARTYMHDVLLADADQMSMAHGLEVRVPFVDHELAACVLGLPEAVKRRPAAGPKPLLVESLGSLLPESIARRPKRGFTLPFPVWMRNGLRAFCEERLGRSGLARRAMFREAAVTSLWTDFLTGHPHATWPRVWSLVVLASWLDQQHVAD